MQLMEILLSILETSNSDLLNENEKLQTSLFNYAQESFQKNV